MPRPHQTILKREDSELTKRIYQEQLKNPSTGDFVKLLENDFKVIKSQQNDITIQNTSKYEYKQSIKKKIKAAAFNYLKEIQETHTKVRDIEYKQLETQKYMLSPIFSNSDVNLLYALRSRSTECRVNFKQKYLHSDLHCQLCEQENEDQQHLLKCSVIGNNLNTAEVVEEKIEYCDIFSNYARKQKAITALYQCVFKIRDKLQENMNSQQAPSNSNALLRMSDDLQQHCTVYSSSGK